MADLTLSNIQTFVLVLLGVAAVIVSIDKGIEAWNNLIGKKEKAAKEQAISNRIGALEERMKACEDRLKKGDDKFKSTSADMTMVLEILNTVLLHMYSGNDHDALRNTIDKLNSYMTKRG